jgi:hypothetical protein
MVTVQSRFEPATCRSLAHKLTNCSKRAHKDNWFTGTHYRGVEGRLFFKNTNKKLPQLQKCIFPYPSASKKKIAKYDVCPEINVTANTFTLRHQCIGSLGHKISQHCFDCPHCLLKSHVFFFKFPFYTCVFRHFACSALTLDWFCDKNMTSKFMCIMQLDEMVNAKA